MRASATPVPVLSLSLVIAGMQANHTVVGSVTRMPAAVPSSGPLKPSAKTLKVSARPLPARSSAQVTRSE